VSRASDRYSKGKVTRKLSAIIINISFKVLANYYGFSPRLAGLMCCQPGSPVRAGVEMIPDGMRATKPALQQAELNSVESHSTDMERHEKVIESEDDPTFVDLNHYNIVNEVWYFCSVDWGSKCEAPRTILEIRTDSARSLHWLQLPVSNRRQVLER